MANTLVKITGGDVKIMANDAGFRAFASKNKANLDTMTSNKMHRMYMRYLKLKGQ
jgi:hypothetical protein